MHEVLVNRLGGLSLPRKSVVRLTDRPDMTLDVYRGRKTTIQQQQYLNLDVCKISCFNIYLYIISGKCNIQKTRLTRDTEGRSKKYRSPLQTEKSLPEGKRIMLETRFTEFLALSVDPRIWISPSALENDDFFSYLLLEKS